eukprot:Gb_19393 [translate_table: standard]
MENAVLQPGMCDLPFFRIEKSPRYARFGEERDIASHLSVAKRHEERDFEKKSRPLAVLINTWQALSLVMAGFTLIIEKKSRHCEDFLLGCGLEERSCLALDWNGCHFQRRCIYVVVSSSYSLFGARPLFFAVFGKSAPQLPIGSNDGVIGPMDQTIGSNQRAS